MILYNDIDSFCLEWIKNLMDVRVIPKGDIDGRPIEDIAPNEISKYKQIHFFCGIGVWVYALEKAGWGDRPVWTGSCPCQPFSTAGKRKGTADERHLWPAWFNLIEQNRPPVIFGEQVSNKDALVWYDLVKSDLNSIDYALFASDMPASAFGAPHIRQRLYFVAERQL